MEIAQHEIQQQLTVQKLKHNLQEAVERNHLNQLKPEINEILFRYLPGDIRLDEFEALASGVFDIIANPTRYLRGRDGN